MLLDKKVINYNLYAEQLSELHLEDPFNIDQILDKSKEILEDSQLNEYARTAILTSYLQISGTANLISLNATAKVQGYFRQLVDATISIKESELTLQEKLGYLSNYLVTNIFILDGTTLDKTTQETVKSILAATGTELVTGEMMIKNTGKYFEYSNHAILPDMFYVMDNQTDTSDVSAYRYVGMLLREVILKLERFDHLYVNWAFTDEEITEQGYDNVLRDINPDQYVRDFESADKTL